MTTNTGLLAIKKADNAVTVQPDNMGKFIEDMIANFDTLKKLNPFIANSQIGEIPKLGVLTHILELDKGLDQTTDGQNVINNGSTAFALKALTVQTFFSRSNLEYATEQRKQAIEAMIVNALQKQFGSDLQDLAFNGDTTSTDAFYKQMNGFIAQAKANTNTEAVVSGATLPSVTELVSKLEAGIDDAYLTDDFVIYMSKKTHSQYVTEINAMDRPLSDATLTNGRLETLGGYRIEIVSRMATNVVLFAPYENLKPVVGFQVQMARVDNDVTTVAKSAVFFKLLIHVDYVIVEDKMVSVAFVTP